MRARARFLAVALAAVALPTSVRAEPPAHVTLAKAVETADFVGIVEVTEAPTGKTFRPGDSMDATAKPVAVLKGDPKGPGRVKW